MVTKRKCQAADEENCPFHGTGKKTIPDFDAGLEKHLEAKTAEIKVLSARNAVTSAVESSLTYQGDKPSWWKEYSDSAAQNNDLPSETILMDVIDSPMGKLAVVWEEESQSSKDRGVSLESGMGLHVCRYKSFETGEDLGYLKLSYVNDDTAKRSFGDDEFTPFKWEDRFSGTSYGFRLKKMEELLDGDMTEDKAIQIRRQIWVTAQRSSGHGLRTTDGKYVASYNIDENNLPDDKTVKQDLKVFAKEFKKSIAMKRKYYKTPYVDFSRVNKELQGQGFGAGIYVYAARKLAERGQVLRGSGLQSGSAQALWVKFNKSFPNNTSKMTLNYLGQKSVAPILDFRVKA